METGVGKTYTYLKTMYELNKRYGWSKFIVVVPSVAIREGVYKSHLSHLCAFMHLCKLHLLLQKINICHIMTQATNCHTSGTALHRQKHFEQAKKLCRAGKEIMSRRQINMPLRQRNYVVQKKELCRADRKPRCLNRIAVHRLKNYVAQTKLCQMDDVLMWLKGRAAHS